MEKTVLYQFLIDVPRAAAIWSVLLVLALGVLTVLVARPEPVQSTGQDPDTPDDDDVAADLRRYAGEVAVAAAGAAQNASRRRDAWQRAQAELDRAWAAYDEAESAARRLAAAAALPSPATVRTPAEYVARERWLHRAVMTAHWRGDLSIRQLTDALAHRSGWDPRRHPVEQEIFLARVVRDGRLAAYQAARQQERDAWRTAELAAEAAGALSTEAYAAAQRLRPALLPAPRRVAIGRPAAVLRWRPARVG
ncbi:hypothetical protein E0H26_17160 [Micromonospora zingiberis]|uniref:AP2/ERF domain-containing protein n=1 Tax=Micromonospora zingiberis TaxID=2053011 RepID=A0A4R0GKH5_9ACTN|nr:hypothetical protein [Micromonospora zingiberis]TCB95901.1 hypothetical protein E0H26_17160 [Micromonospora zingiberis]